MSNPYFFIKKENFTDGLISFFSHDYNHLIRVLRAKIGDIVELSDNEGKRYTTAIEEIRKDEVRLIVKDSFNVEKKIPEIFLYQCILKKESMELAIQKTVEIGIDCIIPVSSSRVVAEPVLAKLKTKVKRWQQIANQASMQSKRDFMTSIASPEKIESIKIKNYDLFFMPVENLDKDTAGSLIGSVADLNGRNQDSFKDIKKLLSNGPSGSISRIAYIIGPEGGFEKQEKDLLFSRGVIPLSFGKNILRSETASIYFLSIIDYVLKSN